MRFPIIRRQASPSFTLTNLYHSYGLVAGVGSILALLVALLLTSTSYKTRKISLLSVFPSLFNNGAPLMVGVPVLLNLVYLVPFLLAPMVNMGIAAIALALRLMPAAVYPVPDGTPSLLYALSVLVVASCLVCKSVLFCG